MMKTEQITGCTESGAYESEDEGYMWIDAMSWRYKFTKEIRVKGQDNKHEAFSAYLVYRGREPWGNNYALIVKMSSTILIFEQSLRFDAEVKTSKDVVVAPLLASFLRPSLVMTM